MQADRRLQVGSSEPLAQQAAELAIEADVDLASASLPTSATWLPSGKVIATSAPIPSTMRRISARSLAMLKVP